MTKVKTLDDLKRLREKAKNQVSLRERSDKANELVQIKVAMATCAIASGSRSTMNFIVDELEKRNIEAVVTQTGCMGYCYAEPTVEVTIPGKEPVVFWLVDEKADEIIEKYIKSGELVDGIIPQNYESIN
ncbi:MAG: (2Fe-2S) ferredoxin domain-containing protein [Bacteroidales bacterium]|nr:(2Fe-2S) ferredoxin domain-containing protein [Bacteroidales bacterium]